MARLLKPFRDHAVERISKHPRPAGAVLNYAPDDDEVRPEIRLPGAAASDGWTSSKLADDDSALCLNCGRRYQLA